MGYDEAFVIHCHCQDRHRLRSRADKIVEDAPLALLILAGRQLFSGPRVTVLTQGTERFPNDGCSCLQAQVFSAQPDPLARPQFFRCVVVVHRQVLVEIVFRPAHVSLCGDGEHRSIRLRELVPTKGVHWAQNETAYSPAKNLLDRNAALHFGKS